MKKVLLLCASIIIIFSNGCLKSQSKKLTYQNILILSDLSSRIDNKPIKDQVEIHKIVQYFRNECVKPGEKIGDKSCVAFSTFSSKIMASIDIGEFETLGEKQQFVNSTGKYKNNGLTFRIEAFEKKIDSVYKNTRDKGLDLISILIEKIENEPILKNNTFISNGIDTTYLNFDNHIYIFTDGYLEYRDKSSNKQFYFGTSEIEEIRKFCRSNKVNVTKALEMDDSLSLPAYKSDRNKFINLHVVETHERDKNDQLQTYTYPKGLRDNEILEEVWRKWAKDSGFNGFDWAKY